MYLLSLKLETPFNYLASCRRQKDSDFNSAYARSDSEEEIIIRETSIHPNELKLLESE